MSWHEIATLVISLAALGGSVWSYCQNVKASKLQNSSQLVNTIKQQFESRECRASRERLARALLQTQAPSDERNGPRQLALDRDDVLVLEVFEQIGYLVRRRVLDEGIVWSVFAWDVIRYDEALRQMPGGGLLHIARERSGQPTLFRDFEALAKRLRAFGLRECPGRRDAYESREIIDYLTDEAGGESSYEREVREAGSSKPREE